MNSRHPTKHACLTIATVCSLSVIGNSHAEDVLATAIGEAYDLDSAAPLYSETHCQNGDPDARDVVYRDVSGRLIALKTLDYKSGPTTPSFVQKNFYPQESIAVTLQQDTLTMSISSDGDTEPVKRLTTKPDPDLPVVIDAGFDTFVTQHWDKLVAGERHSFQFPFAARETLVELRIKPSSCSYATQTDQCFSLEMNNWLLRALVAPIELGYDSTSKRLARYRGLSNIGDANGDGLVVDIHYRYVDVPASDCHVNATEFSGPATDIERPHSHTHTYHRNQT